jgi:hypothetical protein
MVLVRLLPILVMGLSVALVRSVRLELVFLLTLVPALSVLRVESVRMELVSVRVSLLLRLLLMMSAKRERL